MSIRDVVCEWLEWGVEPGDLPLLQAEDQRHFVADVFQSSSEWMYDAFSEGFSRNPAKLVELGQAFREGDLLQIGAIVEKVWRTYVIKSCADYWESEFTMVKEQESDYSGDE